MKNSLIIPLAIIAGGGILAIALWVSIRETALPTQGEPAATIAAISPLMPQDTVLGNPSAPVILINYTDFECSHCRDFALTLRRVGETYGVQGTVAIMYRNFPITERSENAKQHARAAECVARVAGTTSYLAFTDLLYHDQPVAPTKHGELAQKAGANSVEVLACVRSAATNGIDAKIDRERAEVMQSGAIGTPHTLMLVRGADSVVLPGAWGYADLRDVIDSALEAIR